MVHANARGWISPATPAVTPPERPLRVVAWPAEKNRGEQPYNALLTQSLRDAGVTVEEFTARGALSRPDVWHMHWPDGVLNDRNRLRAARHVLGLLALMQCARMRGTSIVWTVHNLATHDRLYPAMERLLWRILPRRVDGFISLSEAGRAAALRRFPALRRARGFVVPLGHFRGVYPDTVSRTDARMALRLPPDASVVAFVGQVRPYKGVEDLIRRFRELPGDALRLVVAGKPITDRVARDVHLASDRDARIQLRLEFVADADIQLILRAADLIVLPFVEILNSASAMLALSFDRPILVPAAGALEELRDTVGGGWVRTYSGRLTGAHLLEAVEAAARLTGAPNLDPYAWPEIGRRTRDAYLAIREGNGRADG